MSVKKSIQRTETKETSNIPQAIKEFALERKLSLREVDFVIAKTTTEIKLPTGEIYNEINQKALDALESIATLTDPELSIRQVHQITLREFDATATLQIDASVMANKHKTAAYATIKTSSKLRDFANLKNFLTSEINKIKARFGMIIGIKEGSMQKDIALLADKIKVHNKLTEPFRVELCNWGGFEPPIDDLLILHYKEKDQKAPSALDRIDYADRGFVSSVEIGDLIVEYIKPKSGTDGRDFYGRIINAREPKIRYTPITNPDPKSIETKNTIEKFQYFATKKGYVKLEGGSLSIGDEVEVSRVDFRQTGDIKAGLDKDVKIHITGKDELEDQIGQNTKIEASEIVLNGNVASKAVVKAEKFTAGGQTHSTSQITADEAEIGVHRGRLFAKNAKIKRVEQGQIDAVTVEIETMVGGIVAAREVKINTLHSNATIIASHKVEIGTVVGGDNRIFIKAAANREDSNRLKLLIDEQKQQQNRLATLEKQYKSKKEMLLRNKDQVLAIKTKIDSEKEANRTVPTIYIDRYKNFLVEMKKAEEMHGELNSLNDKLGYLNDEIGLIQNSVLKAMIINHDVWRNYNEIRFNLISPPKEITFVPQENSKATEIKLELAGVDEYIVRITE